MSEQLENPFKDETEERYIALCQKIMSAGNATRDEIFKHIENDDWEPAFEMLEDLKAFDNFYRLALQKGTQIREANKPRPTPEQIAEEQKKIDEALLRAVEARGKKKH